MKPFLLALCFLATFGCSGEKVESDPGERGGANREALPSCGEVQITLVSSSDDAASTDGLACLREAMDSGQGAELKITLFTDEGDPVIRYRRVTPSGGIEQFTDNTQDSFGEQGWTYTTCDNTALQRISDC